MKRRKIESCLKADATPPTRPALEDLHVIGGGIEPPPETGGNIARQGDVTGSGEKDGGLD